MPGGELALDRSEDQVLALRMNGPWCLGSLPSSAALQQVLASGSIRRVVFDTRGLGHWDSGLLTFLRRVEEDCAARHVDMDRAGLPDGVQRLLQLAEAVPEHETGRAAGPGSLLERAGQKSLDTFAGARDVMVFLGETTMAFVNLLRGRARFPPRDFWLFVQDCGPRALPIVSLVSFLVGQILAFMGAIQLRQFGAQLYVADLVGIGTSRNMGAIMVGIIMAGRTGAAFAAQLGTMTVNEEVDALRTMGISPIEYLVLPRMLALILMMPLLVLYGDALAILGGLIVGVTSLDIGFAQYLAQTRRALSIEQFAAGLFQGFVYGIIVALAGCMRGMKSGRSAAAVGDATTQAVVLSILGIIVACGMLSVIYDVLGI